MKRIILLSFLIALSIKAYSQNNMVTLSGGYSFAKIEDTDVKATGFRINGLYEFNQSGDKIAHGLSVGFISISATEDVLQSSVTYTINSLPVYYAPKYMFGKEKFKGFVKGAIGGQFANLNADGENYSVSDNDFGFYGGVGAGLMIFITDKIFINGEYEIAWASNNYYKDGWMNTAMVGIGLRF
jgi:hypothetical protein